MWLWTSDTARSALATCNLGVILRAYRAITATSQRQLAEQLGYDTTYISMIENGRRDITDVATLLRLGRHLRLPPHSLGVTDPDDADFTAMLQFAESTIRLAVIARHAGHGGQAVDELWPVVARLEARTADRHCGRDVLHLLARARAELGVSLGYVLPEERLPAAATWTRRALWLARNLDDNTLLANTLRAHGNELRKTGHPGAAVHHLLHAAQLDSSDRSTILIPLARAAGDHGNTDLFDHALTAITELADNSPVTSPYAIMEVRLRGLAATGRVRQAVSIIEHGTTPAGSSRPPQWQAMLHITTGEILTTTGETTQAGAALTAGIDIAETHRLPHQIQRAFRTASPRHPTVAERANAALSRLQNQGNDPPGSVTTRSPADQPR